MKKIIEIWKDIENDFVPKGYYQISNLGRVKSLPRQINRLIGSHKSKSKILEEFDNGNGYYIIHLSFQKTQKKFYIHRLIAKAFIPNPDNKPNVNHKDGNGKNNDIKNLEWCTQSENVEHAFRTGLNKGFGEGHSNSKLTYENVSKIRVLLGTHSQMKISKMFGVSRSCIQKINENKMWSRL